MTKLVIDKMSGTILDAEHCVIVDDTELSEDDNFVLEMGCSDAETIEIAERRGKSVLDYRNPDEVHIVWCAEDVQTLSMNLTDAEATKALQKVSGTLKDLSISYGWEILEVALAENDYEITMDEER